MVYFSYEPKITDCDVFDYKTMFWQCCTKDQEPSLWGDGEDMSPQLLDRGDIISFVPHNIL